MDIILKLKELCEEKIKKCKFDGKKREIDAYLAILDVLNTKNGLLKLQPDIAISMINSLVQDEQMAKNIYLSLLDNFDNAI